jgi:hypothetical protein
MCSAVPPVMPSTKSHDLHDLTLRVEAEHNETARSCELRCLDELEQRRRALAAERERLFQQVLRAAGM